MGKKLSTVLIGCFATLACAKPAPVPKFPASADQRTREALYDEYRLTGDVGVFSAAWTRRDGEYSWEQLGALAKQYPASSEVYDRANTRGLVLGTIGGTGGGLIGATLGYNLTAPPSERWSDETQIAMYSSGGALILIAFVTGLAWRNPALDFESVYNDGLRRELKLSEHGVFAPSFAPRLLGRGELGWQF